MAAQDHEPVTDSRSPRRAQSWSLLGITVAAYLVTMLILMRGLALPHDAAIGLTGLLIWSLVVVVIEARAGEAWLGLFDYGGLFDIGTGALVQAGMTGVCAVVPTPTTGAIVVISLLTTLPCLAIVGLTKRVLFTVEERTLLRDARKRR